MIKENNERIRKKQILKKNERKYFVSKYYKE